jgi:hypothetical protein
MLVYDARHILKLRSKEQKEKNLESEFQYTDHAHHEIVKIHPDMYLVNRVRSHTLNPIPEIDYISEFWNERIPYKTRGYFRVGTDRRKIPAEITWLKWKA